MKILLVLPAVPHLRITKENQNVPKRNMLRFSILPLLTVAGLTPQGHEVDICDENVEPLDLETDADLIGVSFMTATAQRAYEIAMEFQLRGKMTVAGGYHPSFMPKEALKYFDSVAIGDAEEIWPQIVKDATEGKLREIYRHEKLPELHNLPLPKRDLMNKKADKYATINAVQTGRGCRNSCRYCSVAAFHKSTYRCRPIEEVLEEIKRLDKNFIFVDDNIISDPVYAKELFTRLIPLKKKWISQSSINIADDPELLKLARKSGCRGLFIGIETMNEKNLSSVEKGFNDSRNYFKRIKRIRKQGIAIIAGMIVGMDNDTPEVFRNTLRFLAKSGIDALQLNIMTPLPGTPLFEDMEKSGRITTKDWSKYDFRHVVMRPQMMTAEELQQGADWVYNQFYKLRRIIPRFLKTLFTCGPLPAFLSLKLNMTYRYDNIRESITGCDPLKARNARETSNAACNEYLPTVS